MKKFIAILIFFSVLGAQENIEKKFLVNASTVKKGYIAEYVYSYGRITSNKEALVYPTMPGKLIKYLVKEGERVKKDQVIALLDRDIPGVKTEPLKVKSPIDGIVTVEYGKIGQMMVQSMPVAMVVGDKRWIESGIAAEDIRKIKVGQRAFVKEDKIRYQGRVVRKSFGIDPMTGTGKVYIEVPKANLLPGATVGVEVAVRENKNALYIPVNALVEREGKVFVFKYRDGKAHMVEVKTGIEGKGFVEVEGDLMPGDTVITLGAEGLYEGADVEIKGEVK